MWRTVPATCCRPRSGRCSAAFAATSSTSTPCRASGTAPTSSGASSVPSRMPMSGKVPEPPRDLAALRALRADGTTRLGVVGWPIDHSASPALHGAALATLAAAEPSFAAWEYRAYALRPEELAEALPLAAERGFRGLNLTVPHK